MEDLRDDHRTEYFLPEVAALRAADYSGSRGTYLEDAYRKSAVILRDARLLRPRLRGVFALRALVHRGRAKPTSKTPEVVARLIGGSLPDPLTHLVCKFWLGDPPRRRRSEKDY